MEFMNIVRMRVKEGKMEELRGRMMQNMQAAGGPPPGLIEVRHVQIEENAICVVGRWESKEAFSAMRGNLVKGLDNLRDLLVPYREGLGDTDPVSGGIVFDSSKMGG
jgi:hypothetical protein